MGRTTSKDKIKRPLPKIKIQIDQRTVITVKTEKKLEYWLKLYPKAKVID